MQGFTYKYGDRPLEGYTIQRAAGRGGFGEVYYALSDSGREVALKAVQGYEAIELRGISQCMNLKSPHLVTIFDVKYNEAGKPFVLMEYVAGPSLRELLDQSPAGLGTQKTAFFLREMAKGLTYLHDRGIVHRDLKPGNVFYEDGYVKIGDYGLSKAMSASRHSGQTITVGTVHYMAPEIGQGNYDRSIDIYALGCMAYEMLTGQTPYLGASPGEILMKHMVEQPDLTNIEEPFATVIRKALAKDPKDRFQTVQEMVEAVFGAAHIQQSVSCFSPDSLTMVAGRVAQKVTAGGPGSSGQVMGPGGGGGVAGDGQGEWIDRFGQRMERVEQKIEAAGDRLGEKLEQVAGKVRQKWQGRGQAVPPMGVPIADRQATELDPPVVDPKRDPLIVTQRRLLGLVSGAVVALGAGFVTGQTSWGGSPDGALLASLVPFLAILVGMSLVWPQLGKSLVMESRLMRRLAFGGVAGILALITSYVGYAIAEESGMRPFADRYFPGTVIAVIVPLLVMDWSRIMNPARRQRVSLGHALWAGSLGLILGLMFDGVAPVVMGALCAASLGLQVALPYDPFARRGRALQEPRVHTNAELHPSRSQRRAERRQERYEQRQQQREERRNTWQQHYPQGPYGWHGQLQAGVWTASGYRLLPPGVSPLKRAVALPLIAGWFLGLSGLQRFYAGKIWTGLLWLCTLGLGGVGQIIDAIMILSGNFRDKRGMRLVVWTDYDEVGPGMSATGWQGPTGQGQGSAGQGPIGLAGQMPQAGQVGQAAAPQPVRADDGSGVQPMTVAWDSRGPAPRRLTNPVLSFLGGLLVFVTIVLGAAVGLVVPALIVAGASSPGLANEPMFDVLTDQDLFRMISSLAIVLAGLLMLAGAILMLLARRRAGAAHILRGIAGSGAALLSIYAFWGATIPRAHFLEQAVGQMRQQHVQETIKVLSRGMEPGILIFAGGLLLAAITVLAWPARRPEAMPAVGEGV